MWVTLEGKPFEERALRWVIYPRNERLSMLAERCPEYSSMENV